MKSHCMHCSKPCDLEDPDIYREATIWISGEKSNRSALRVYTGCICCADCMKAMKDGQAPGEPTLFDETPLPNTREWTSGFEAGWRGDELAVGLLAQSPDYRAGYDAGRVGRESVDQ